MPSEPNWLPIDAVIEFNKQQVELTNENHALLFRDKLEGALVRPQNSFHYEDNHDTISLSVNLMIAIADAHAFEQGNKRTGFASGYVFMITNGYDVDAGLLDAPELGQAFTEVIKHTRTASEFEMILKGYVFPV